MSTGYLQFLSGILLFIMCVCVCERERERERDPFSLGMIEFLEVDLYELFAFYKY